MFHFQAVFVFPFRVWVCLVKIVTIFVYGGEKIVPFSKSLESDPWCVSSPLF